MDLLGVDDGDGGDVGQIKGIMKYAKGKCQFCFLFVL